MEALVLSCLAGFATSAGSLLVLALGELGRTILGCLLGLAAGIMLGVTASDLVPAAWQAGGAAALAGGAVSGLISMAALGRVLRAFCPPGRAGYLRLGYLITTAIAMHDLPEGMAIAVGFAARPELGLGLALAIGLHNLPEGMVTAAPLLQGGLAPWRILIWSVLLAACTPCGTLLGMISVSASAATIAPLLAAAAVAMVYVVVMDLLPAALKNLGPAAFFSVALGFAVSWAI